MLLLDMNGLKNPGLHASHSGCAVAVPGAFVYFPGGHLVWALHHSKLLISQSTEKETS